MSKGTDKNINIAIIVDIAVSTMVIERFYFW